MGNVDRKRRLEVVFLGVGYSDLNFGNNSSALNWWYLLFN